MAPMIMAAAPPAAVACDEQAATAQVLEFLCLFTHDIKRKQKRWQDGRLRYHTFNKRLMVYDERGNFVGDSHWREQSDLEDGDELELERGMAIIQVSQCVAQREQDLSELVDKRVEERHRKAAASSSRNAHYEAPEMQPGRAGSRVQKWHRPLAAPVPASLKLLGRAVIPPESPYQRRQIDMEVVEETAPDQPQKRRRLAEPPAGKAGYAQSLFGTRLTLSAGPVYQRQSVASQVVSSRQPSQEVKAIHYEHSAQADVNRPPLIPRSSIPDWRASGLGAEFALPPSLVKDQNIQRNIKDLSSDDFRAPSLDAEPANLEGRHGAAKFLSADASRDVVCPMAEELSVHPQPKFKAGSYDTALTLAQQEPCGRVKEAGTPQDSVPGGKGKEVQKLDAFTKGRSTSEQPEIVCDSEEHSYPARKTELRIKPRQRRGLMLMSTKVQKAFAPSFETQNLLSASRPNSAQHDESAAYGEDRAASSELPSSSAQRPRGSSAPNQNCCAEAPMRHADLDLQDPTTTTPVSGNAIVSPGLSTRQLEAASQALGAPNLIAQCYRHESKSETSVEKEQQTLDSCEMGPHAMGFQDSGPQYVSLPQAEFVKRTELPIESSTAASPPRLVKLGRKTTRSREIIGYIPRQNSIWDEAMTTILRQPRKAELAGAVTTDVTSPRKNAAIPRELAKDMQLSSLSGEPLTANTEEGCGLLLKPQQTPRLLNPATRGKKAAKPCDAAGQMPQGLMPLETERPLVRTEPILRASTGNARPKAAPAVSTRLPGPVDHVSCGFTKASGGPWSKEAMDLFTWRKPGA